MMRVILNDIHFRASARHWLNTLDELRQENIVLKNRLSDAVKGHVSRANIEAADSFLQHFVDKDQVFDLLRHETIALLEQLDYHHQCGHDDAALTKRFCLLERDMQRVADEFWQMKAAFINWLQA